MKEKQRHTCWVKVRLTPDEKERVLALMDSGGYPTMSSYLRDVITRKTLRPRFARPGLDAPAVRELFNRLVYQVNKIGVNYNQVVSTYQRQAMGGKGSERLMEGRMAELMRLTEGLRDEFAVFLEQFREYLGESPDTSTT